MYVAHLLLRGRPLSTQDVWRGLDICPSGEKETFNVCHHTWWPRCRLLGSSPPPLMYSPPLIPEEGSPRPFRLLITRAKTLRGPNLSLSLCLPFSLSLQPAVSPLSGVREASFNSAREQDPPLSRGGNVHERERERERVEMTFSSRQLFLPLILWMSFVSCLEKTLCPDRFRSFLLLLLQEKGEG